jgi:predicted TIM-barrel fold metal-dependent hydrolase
MSAHRIDVHCHTIPDFFREAVARSNHVSTSGVFPEWTPQLAIDTMDRHGIAASITSVSYPGVHFGNDLEARALARRCNEMAADMAARWPGRFGAFATLPLPDVDGAIDEAGHALDVLRLDGVCLLASYRERFLGDPWFDPLLEKLNDAGAVVFVHPAMHPSSRATGLRWPGFMMEFLFDTTRAAVNLLFSGALERYPRIRFILSHAGGVLPYFSWRLSVAPMISPLLKDWSEEQILAGIRKFWFDTALSPGRQTMGCLKEVADPSRILFGSDWPFAPSAVTAKSIATLNAPDLLTPQDLVSIERNNALALFPRFAATAS